MIYSKSPEIKLITWTAPFHEALDPIARVIMILSPVSRFSLPNAQLTKYEAPRLRARSPSWDE